MKDASKWKHEPWLKPRAYDQGSVGKTPRTQPHSHMLWKCKQMNPKHSQVKITLKDRTLKCPKYLGQKWKE
jgi:hypothetical protein